MTREQFVGAPQKSAIARALVGDRAGERNLFAKKSDRDGKFLVYISLVAFRAAPAC